MGRAERIQFHGRLCSRFAGLRVPLLLLLLLLASLLVPLYATPFCVDEGITYVAAYRKRSFRPLQLLQVYSPFAPLASIPRTTIEARLFILEILINAATSSELG